MNRRLYAVFAGTIFAAVAVGIVAGFILDKNGASASKNNPSTANFPLLAKRIFVEDANDILLNFSELRESMRSYYSENQLQGTIYFEYLPTGTAIRVGDEQQEVAASLIKVPIAMELYKAKELGKIDIDKEIELQPDWLDDEFGDLYKQGAGYKLTLREAARIMLEESDNTALKAIAYSNVDKLEENQNVLGAIDVDFSVNRDQTVALNARSYSSILKCLYFSCYLNYEDSQELLDYLTKSGFNNRLVAGVDNDNILVAHKIGVYNVGKVQSDCGIVYIPNRNYVLCAMLRGPDDETTDGHIAALSKLAYEYLKDK